MNDRYYSQCQRCGDQAGAWSHLIKASGRLLCGKCWRELAWDKHGHKVDDLVTYPHNQGDVDNRTSGEPDVTQSKV